MTYNYLWAVNRLCEKFNEVPLTSSNFAGASGVYSDFKSSVNAAVLDIYQEEDQAWPFAWYNTTFVTAAGTNEYSKHASALSVDWESFYIKKAPLSVFTATQTSGVATVTVTAGHQLETGDTVYISGATQSAYNGDHAVTVVSSTVFTYTVDSSTVSPATGTIVMYPPYSTKKLLPISYDCYMQEGYLERDDSSYRDEHFSPPLVVARKPDNNFIISPKPDRIYTISYNYYAAPTEVTLYNEVPPIPEAFKEVVVAGAVYFAYMFRDNIEQAAMAKNEYQENVNRMRRILIEQPAHMRAVN